MSLWRHARRGAGATLSTGRIENPEVRGAETRRPGSSSRRCLWTGLRSLVGGAGVGLALAANPPAPPPLPPLPSPASRPAVSPTGRPAGLATNTVTLRRSALPSATALPADATGGGGSYLDPAYIPGLAPAPPTRPVVPTSPRTAIPKPLPAPVQETVLAWDGLVKEATLKPGEYTARFTFALTNTAANEITLNAVRTSCGCTVPKLPAMPWTLAAQSHGTFDVDVDVRGKSGILTKTIYVDTTAGYRYLTVRVSVPASNLSSAMSATDRVRNMQAALADRQAVFKGDCGACHLQPALGKQGPALFDAACGVCHDAVHRASMVPNLRALNRPADRDYWKSWITKGKEGTLMPAWGIREGGPLTEAQIESLVEYLTGPFRTSPAPAAAAQSVGVPPASAVPASPSGAGAPTE